MYCWERCWRDMIKEKYEEYIADMLWVRAVGAKFVDDKEEPTAQRWSEIVNPKPKIEAVQITKEDIKARFLQLKIREA